VSVRHGPAQLTKNAPLSGRKRPPPTILLRLVNLFKVRIRLTHFDPLGPLQKIGADQICSKKNIATSMDGVVQVRRAVSLRCDAVLPD
jgi:hypothetical protein